MPLIEDANLFMMCPRPHRDAFTPVPHGFSVRPARREEWDTWLTFPFDTRSGKETYRPFMVDYFNRVYRPKEADFWRACQFLCDKTDTPVGTCFLWRAYGTVVTLHWFKVKKEWEGKGLGRALLSAVLATAKAEDGPIYLHTQPGSYRAIKLYTDFGFSLLTDPVIGYRSNDLTEALPYLREKMTPSAFYALRFQSAPPDFLTLVQKDPDPEF